MCGELKSNPGQSCGCDRRKIVTILVDDSPFMLEGVSKLLRNIEGVEVRGTAADGTEGLNLVLATRPDLVLVDFQMPRMDGIAVARLIREAQPDVKIILITAHDLDAVRRSAFISRVDEVLCKQQLPSQLARTVRALFPARFTEQDEKETLE